MRQVDLPDALRRELTALKLRTRRSSEGPMLRFALGDDPVYVAAQLGHTEPGFSMKVYASAVRRRERLIGAALREFDAALDWAAMGSGEPFQPIQSRALATDKRRKRLSRAFHGIGPDSSAG